MPDNSRGITFYRASTDVAALRARAFTLFTRAYDDARRALIYLRWHEGDADSIAPSLFAKRTKGKRKDTGDDDADDTLTSPVAPGPLLASSPVTAPTSEAALQSLGGIVIPTGPPNLSDRSGRGPFE